MRKNRHLSPAALVLVAALAAPAAFAEPIGASAGWIDGWWQGTAAWMSEWLPEVGQRIAASSDEEPSSDDGEATSEDDVSVLSLGVESQSEGGPHWDPDG